MKGYFSQLARHTGLHFGDAKRQPVRPATPLHVEEVALVQATVPFASVSTDVGPTAPEKTDAAPVQATQPLASSTEPLPPDTRVSVVDEQSKPAVIDRESFAIEEKSISTNQNVEVDQTASSSVEQRDRLERVEVEFVPHVPLTQAEITSQETKVDSKPQDSSGVDLSEPVERERMVRQYLREVHAWVAAGPTAEAIADESQSLNNQQPESVAIAVERSPQPLAQPATRDAIDVHDMNLSIGTISVVIEEPKPAAAAVIAPTPAAPAPQPQTQHEPISLSRYYLRSW